MEFIDRSSEVEIAGICDFDLTRIFECGQCFRWDADDSGAYTGVAMGRAACVRKVGESVFISCTAEEFQSIWHDYFDLARDYSEIRRQLSIDDYMCQAAAFGAGIRILRQDKWEALCSFIVSQCNNIPRIKKIIAALCREFGDKFEFRGKVYYAFPKAEMLAALEAKDLEQIRCGYRAEYIVGAAKAIANGSLDLDALSKEPPEKARRELKKLRGIGDKVADCAALFGLNMLDSFPRDVWINRAIAHQYGPDFDPKVFSPYAGIAQQYIFYYTRGRKDLQ